MAFEESLPPTQPAGAGPPTLERGRVPWGIADIAKAIGLVVIGIIVITIPAVAVAAAIADDVDVDEDAEALAIVLGAGLGLEIVILLSTVRFSVRKYRLPWADLGLRWPRRGSWWLPVVLALVGLTFVVIFAVIIDAAGADADSNVPDETFDNVAPLVLLAILSLAFAPIIEELFFRGFIFGGLRGRWGTLWAALASGLLFGLAHLGNPGTAYTIVPIAAVGALFALGYAYSGSLLATIGAHFLFNLSSLLVGLLS